MLTIVSAEDSQRQYEDICKEFELFNIYLSDTYGYRCYTELEHILFIEDYKRCGYWLTINVNDYKIKLKVTNELLNSPQRENLKKMIIFACVCNS